MLSIVETKTNRVMNERLEEQLASIIEKSIQLAEKTGEFVVEQSTELLQEFYAWHTAMHIFYIVVSIIFVIIAFTAPKLLGSKKVLTSDDMEYGHVSRNVKFLNRNYENEMPSIVFSIIICVLFNISAIIIFLVHVHSLIQICIAPKLYIIEYFMK